MGIEDCREAGAYEEDEWGGNGELYLTFKEWLSLGHVVDWRLD